MKQLRFALLFALLAATGCYSTSGQKGYHNGSIADVYGLTRFDDSNKNKSGDKPTVEQVLARKPDLVFPGKLLIIELGRPNGEFHLSNEIEKALLNDTHFTMIETADTNEYGRPKLENLQMLAARYQAKYAVLVTRNVNEYETTFWIPATISVCTLGLLPIPVGSQERFGTVEMLLMDVPTGILLFRAQDNGHSECANIWGGSSSDRAKQKKDELVIKAALEKTVPVFQQKLSALKPPTAKP